MLYASALLRSACTGKRIGINDVYGESGPAVALLEKYGLDAAGIYKQIKAIYLIGCAFPVGCWRRQALCLFLQKTFWKFKKVIC